MSAGSIWIFWTQPSSWLVGSQVAFTRESIRSWNFNRVRVLTRESESWFGQLDSVWIRVWFGWTLTLHQSLEKQILLDWLNRSQFPQNLRYIKSNRPTTKASSWPTLWILLEGGKLWKLVPQIVQPRPPNLPMTEDFDLFDVGRVPETIINPINLNLNLSNMRDFKIENKMAQRKQQSLQISKTRRKERKRRKKRTRHRLPLDNICGLGIISPEWSHQKC